MYNEPWWKFSSDLLIEVDQAYEQGFGLNREKANAEVERILALPSDEEQERAALAFHQKISQLSLRTDYPYQEPSDWPGIEAALQNKKVLEPSLPDNLSDRIGGVWLGRTIGCLLGETN